ncbi:MAG: plastocyanin/azurin family copper-binding protein, partial [Nitrososphaerales archaeon]
AIALVTTIGSLATFAENQSGKNIDQSRANMPMMQGNTGTDMMDGTNMMPRGTNQQQQMMRGNMGSMMNMMSMGDMMPGDMMGNGMNMGMMNSTMSMQDMMDPNYVHMGMNMFMPNDMKTSIGARITWQNHDHVVHNVVGVFKTDAGDKISVRSPDLSHMDSWSYTFSGPGTFEYVCSYHESQGMQGRILISS